jgi:hypothetical protein
MIAVAAKIVHKVKQPPLPADPLGARFCQIFNHPWNSIVAPVPEPGQSPSWHTQNRYPLQPRNLWELYKNPSFLVGLRFGPETRYALIDIDRGSPYHPENNSENFRLVLQAAEEIGLCRHTLVQSSNSGGLHVYFFLPEPVSSFGVACALKFALSDSSCQLKQGELELFPNVKPYNKNKPTDYNGHRLPLQSGSCLLDANLQPVTNDLSRFLDWADVDAAEQDMEALLEASAAATARQKATSYNRSASGNAQEWKRHLETRMEQGWTGSEQTNDLLKDFVCYGRVWMGLSGEALIDYVVAIATNAPGYEQYCSHQQEIRQRAAQWVHSTEANQFYTPYCSIPPRLATYRETYNNVSNPDAANNIIPFRNLINEERRAQAHERIKNAIAHMEITNTLPLTATARAKALVATIKELFGVTVSHKTLYKSSYLVLWHPKGDSKGCGINDLSTNLDTSSSSILVEEGTSEKIIKFPEALPLEDSQEIPTPPPYMKVGDELSAPDAPQGHQGAADLKQGGFRGDFAASPAAVEPSDAAKAGSVSSVFLKKTSASDAVQNHGEIENLACVEREASISADATNDLTTSSVEDSATVATEPTAEVTSKPPKDLSRITKIRLEATVKAQKQLRWKALSAIRPFTGEERERYETLFKMQFFSQSGEPILMEEVTAWASATPGVIMTDSGPALVDEVQSNAPSERSLTEPASEPLLDVDLKSNKSLDYDEADYLDIPDPSWFTPPDVDIETWFYEPTNDTLRQDDPAEPFEPESPDAFSNSNPEDHKPPFPVVGDVVWRNPCQRYRKGMMCRVINVTYTGAWTDNNWHISAYAWEKGLFVPYDPQRHQSD